MIVGTAGHIDHGKTTLVHALTGVDTDRLPEEKKRGISIELGYAFLDVPGSEARIGFIDVPGHERLVHTMLAGATGIDLALLLIAADDGVMPQTLEHLAVLSLLGVSRAIVAVTKCDRVEGGRLHEVMAQARLLLQGTPIDGAPVLAVSAQRGDGLDELRNLLFDAARSMGPHALGDAGFRLAVDRSFSLEGTGTVVTGTVYAGQVAIGDELRIVPGTASARVRSIHAQNRPVLRAQAGERCALGLAGIERHQIRRGQWLVTPAAALSSERIDVQLALWHGETKPLRSGMAVHVHIGAADVPASVAVLEPATLMPGESGLVQLLLHAPTGAWWGDRVVLRDASASRTLAGGTVLDPYAPARYRRTTQRLAELQALAAPAASERLSALLKVAPQGVDLRRFEAANAGTPAALPADALHHADTHEAWALGALHARAAGDKTLAALAAYHQSHPEELGPDAARLRRLALPRLALPLWRALMQALRTQGTISVRGAFVHLPEHGVKLSGTEERVAQKVAAGLRDAGFEGAWVRDLARAAGEPEAVVRVTLARLAQRGELHQVVRDLYYPPEAMASLSAIARTIADAHDGEVSASQFRDGTALGRKRAIQILEYLDRIGVLRRVGDVHRLRRDSQLFADASP